MSKSSTLMLVVMMFAASAAMGSVAHAASPQFTDAGRIGKLRIWSDAGGVYFSLIDVAHTNPAECGSTQHEYYLDAANMTVAWNALLAAKLSGRKVSLRIWGDSCLSNGYPIVTAVYLD